MTKLELAKKIIDWHLTEGVKLREQHTKKDCLGRIIWAGDIAYFDLLKYFEGKSEFTELEIDFILHSQYQDLLQRGEFFKFCPEFMKHEHNSTIIKILIEQNHYLSRFLDENKYFPYQRKQFLEKDCCYKLAAPPGKYYWDKYLIVNGSDLKDEVLNHGLVKIGRSKLNTNLKLNFSGFYKLSNQFMDVPIFNMENKDNQVHGIALFKESKPGKRLVSIVREDLEKLNSYDNYQSTGILGFL